MRKSSRGLAEYRGGFAIAINKAYPPYTFYQKLIFCDIYGRLVKLKVSIARVNLNYKFILMS